MPPKKRKGEEDIPGSQKRGPKKTKSANGADAGATGGAAAAVDTSLIEDEATQIVSAFKSSESMAKR